MKLRWMVKLKPKNYKDTGEMARMEAETEKAPEINGPASLTDTAVNTK